ncbi:AMP-binding protein, partial [Paenibacillus aurantiacus]
MTIRNLTQLLTTEQAEGRGITFLQGGGETYRLEYRDLYRRASIVLGHLQSTGLKRGDELVIQIEHNRLFVLCFWACVLGGIIPVPLHSGAGGENKKKLVGVWKKLNNPSLITDAADGLRRTLAGDAGSDEERGLLAGIAANLLDAELADRPGDPGERFESTPEDIAFIQFSSGSTGEPKGVVLTHGNLLANMRAIIDCSGASGGDSSLSWMPMTHDMGLIGFHLTPIMAGMNHYLMPTALFVQQPTLWMQVAHERRITTLASPNFGYRHFLAHYKKDRASEWDLSCVRLIFNGAEPISAGLCRQFLDELSDYGLRPTAMFPVYGMAEASLAVTFPVAGAPLAVVEIERGSRIGEAVVMQDEGAVSAEGGASGLTFLELGRPVTDCEVRICGEDDQLYPEDVIGEIQIRGSSVTRGYYNDAVSTRQAFAAEGWLRTGDLGFMRDGRLVVTGRKKDVLFANGRNIYPHDLEEMLQDAANSPVRRVAACGVFNAGTQSDDLIVFVVFRGATQTFLPVADWVSEQIRRHAGIDPLHVLPIRQLPRTTSGKLQRYLLARRFGDGAYAKELRELEGALASIVQERRAVSWADNELDRDIQRIGTQVLRVESVSMDDSFFALGGNSLKAAMFISAVHEQLGVRLSMRELYAASTFRAIADLVRQAGPAMPAIVIPSVSRQGHYPLTSAQLPIYMQEQLENIGTSYNIPAAFAIEGPFRTEDAERAFRQLIDRHDALRISFHAVEGETVQRLSDVPISFHIEIIAADETELSGLIRGFVRPFDLTASPLFRVAVIAVAEDRHLLLIDVHHVACDGISMQVLIEEFARLYAGEPLAPLGASYLDYAAWEREAAMSGSFDRDRDYWQQRMSSLPSWRMPADFTRPAKRDFVGAAVTFALPEEPVVRIQRLAEAQGVSVYAAYLAVYILLLHRYGAGEDIVIGALFSGRDHSEVRRTVGMFNRFLPIRASLAEGEAFEKLLLQVNETLMDAFEHPHYPFGDVSSLSLPGDRPNSALYDTMLILHNQSEGTSSFATSGARFSRLDIRTETSKLDFKLDLFPAAGGGMEAVLEYSTCLFKPETMQRLAERFVLLLEAVVAEPGVRIGSIDLLAEDERMKLTNTFNATSAPYRSNVMLHELVEEQAARMPERRALTFGDAAALTYGDLNGHANRLARQLRRKGVGKETIVAVAMERSAEMMIGLLAVLKAGGAYMPLPPELPPQRMAYMLADSGARLVLTQGGLAGKMTEALAGTGAELLVVQAGCGIHGESDADSLASAGGKQSVGEAGDGIRTKTAANAEADEAGNLTREGTPRSAAYVIYTSGSTGVPKGVLVEHRSVVNRLSWMQNAYPLGERDVILQKTPYSFDVSVWE